MNSSVLSKQPRYKGNKIWVIFVRVSNASAELGSLNNCMGIMLENCKGNSKDKLRKPTLKNVFILNLPHMKVDPRP